MDPMSIALPTRCANPDCRAADFRPIHRFSRAVAIDPVNGPPVFAHHITFRCASCGQTWAVQGDATRGEIEMSPMLMARESTNTAQVANRGW
jgi:hypothetical protein